MNQEKLRSIIKNLAAAAIIASAMTFAPFSALAAEEAAPAQATQPAASAAAPTMTVEEAAKEAKVTGYKHTSLRYGYTIYCPKKPNVVPLSFIEQGAKGEVLIFENEGYYMKRAWIVMCDAFDDRDVPTNINTLSEAEKKNIIDDLTHTAGYELVRIADLGFNHGIYCITAKEIEIDTNGDGKPDETASADTQMIKTFFRGQRGGHFAVELIDNPDLTEVGIAAYHVGLLTFEELPPQPAATITVPDKK